MYYGQGYAPETPLLNASVRGKIPTNGGSILTGFFSEKRVLYQKRGTMKRPVLAIDYDGVLVDNIPYWDRYFSQGNCGRKHAVVYDPTDWGRYQKICNTCWTNVLHRPEMTYAIPPREDAKYVIPLLAQSMDLWLVTSRHPSTYEATANLLFWHGLLDHFTGMEFTQNKRAVCESIGAFALIDDATVNIEALQGSSVHPIVWDAAYNSHLQMEYRVRNWQEAASTAIKLAAGYTPIIEAAS